MIDGRCRVFRRSYEKLNKINNRKVTTKKFVTQKASYWNEIQLLKLKTIKPETERNKLKYVFSKKKYKTDKILWTTSSGAPING